MLTELPYDRVWCVDFEFRAGPGELAKPICMVATDAQSGETRRLWEDELERRFGDPPFDTGPRSLFCAYYAAAEWGCFQALGWPRPANMIDLYAEFRVASNGTFVPFGRGLLGALEWFGLPLGSTKDTKDAMRQRVLAGPPWKPGERAQIIEYCESDVRPLPGLLVALLPGIHRISRKGWDHALLRGQYTWEVAAMERHGLPIDEEKFGRLVDRWDDIRAQLVAEVDQGYGVYEGTTFKPGLFLDWLHRERIFEWPRTEVTGRLQLDADTFRDMARAHPKLWPLHQLRVEMSDVRHRQIAVHDGRNRAMLSPFATKTGRNAPGGQFVFTAGSWMRGFIKPPAGRAVAYLDYRAQEVAVAAVLSRDLAMLQAYSSGDPYLRFAVMAGLAPEGASKASHAPIRGVCKVAVLGANYGMREKTLAAQTGVCTAEAEFILRRLRDTWPIYDAWATRQIDIGYLLGRMQTRHGWRMIVTGRCSPTQLRNWVMQSSGADMLRLAVLRARRAGIEVAAPVHDALVIEADAGDIEDAVETTVKAMQDASADVLRGFRVDVDRKVVQWPGRYMDPRGEFMWNKVNALLTA